MISADEIEDYSDSNSTVGALTNGERMMDTSSSNDGNAREARVLVIMTGGTICMKKSANGFVPARGFLKAALSPRPSFNDGSPSKSVEAMLANGEQNCIESLRTPMSAYDKHVRYAVLEFDRLLDSTSISADGWTEIARTIERNYRLFEGFVVLHGTDSLAYTCSALSFMLQNLGKPVILTGSQAPMLELQNDATDNLLGSLIIAGHFMIPEVTLFFNYKLFRGNRAMKISANDFSAFASPNFPPLATITSLNVNVSWELIFRPTAIEPFSVCPIDHDLGHVACLRIFPGIRPEMVDAVLRIKGLKGLVLETFGAGNAPAGPDGQLTRILADAVSRGIVIVSVTQCVTGSVSPLYEPAVLLHQAGVIPGHDMTSEAALTKLSYLFAHAELNATDILTRLRQPIRGELTEHSQTIFRHPEVSMPEHISDLTALGYAIANGDFVKVQEALKGGIQWRLNQGDYSGNTPLHVSATSNSIEILRYLLTQGASVHIRNKAGRTPLFLAANAGLMENVRILVQSGAHFHAEEQTSPVAQALRKSSTWCKVDV